MLVIGDDVPVDAACWSDPDVVVLVEGVSDTAAVQVLAKQRGTDLSGVRLITLNGITNVGTVLSALTADPLAVVQVFGMCDLGEVNVLYRALSGVGWDVEDEPTLAEYGFFVCHGDLEEELIGALGVDATVGVLEKCGLGAKFELFGRQPAWRDRSVPDQLRRFIGTSSGRKEHLAGQLAGALDPDQVPLPMDRLLSMI